MKRVPKYLESRNIRPANFCVRSRSIGSSESDHLIYRIYNFKTRELLSQHLRHTAAAARLCRHGSVLDAGIRAAARDQRVFDDLVELGLGGGLITPRVVRGLITDSVHRDGRASASRGWRA